MIYSKRVLLLVLILISSCSTWRDFSKPYILDDDSWKVSFESNNFDGFLVNKEETIRIHVNPINDGNTTGITLLPIPGVPLGEWGESKNNYLFEVSVLIESYKRGYALNPSRLLLIHNTETIKPVTYAYRNSARGCFNRGSNNVYKPKVMHKIDDVVLPVELFKAKIEIYITCFNFYFNIPPIKTSEKFSIKIDGLYKHESKVNVADVHFSQGTRPSGW